MNAPGQLLHLAMLKEVCFAVAMAHEGSVSDRRRCEFVPRVKRAKVSQCE
jgi:hypothetical protein